MEEVEEISTLCRKASHNGVVAFFRERAFFLTVTLHKLQTPLLWYLRVLFNPIFYELFCETVLSLGSSVKQFLFQLSYFATSVFTERRFRANTTFLQALTEIKKHR